MQLVRITAQFAVNVKYIEHFEDRTKKNVKYLINI